MRQLFATFLMAGSMITASAATITFGPLAGGNGSPYAGHTEVGYTVTPQADTWVQGQVFGNPTPSIFSRADEAYVDIVNGSLFFFFSADLATALQNTTGRYTFAGFVNNLQVFSGSGSTSFGFSTFASPSTTQAIDRLRITMFRGNTSSFNIDNIVLSDVPEPGTWAMLAIGGLALMAFRKR